MTSLYELALIAKSFDDTYGTPRRNIPGAGTAMVAGGSLVAAGGVMAASTRRGPIKAEVNLNRARRNANTLNREAAAHPKDTARAARAMKASRNAEIADLVSANSVKTNKFIRGKSLKTAVIGGAIAGGGYGIKRLNDEA